MVDSPPVGVRAANRLARTTAFLSTALRIVTEEGFDELTMQRLADECDAAIGAVYRYFPSKGALVAEVQREAIERLAASYEVIRARSDRAWVDLDPADLALARLVLFGRFFCATSVTFPQELRLMQMLMGEARPTVPLEEGLRVVPSAMRLLDQMRAGLDAAAEAGVLASADTMGRVVTWAASVGGVLQLSRLTVYDAELFDGEGLARELCLDLLRAWGAAPDRLSQMVDLVDELAVTGPLAPPLASV